MKHNVRNAHMKRTCLRKNFLKYAPKLNKNSEIFVSLY